MRLRADSRHKKEKGLLHKHSPRPCITMDCSKKVDQRGALWRAGGHWPALDDQRQAGLHQLRMFGLGSSPGAPGCLPRACPPRPVPSTTPAVAQASLGARRGRQGGRGICGTKGGATGPPVPAAQTSTEQRPGREGRPRVWGRPGLLSMDCAPQRVRRPFWAH